MSKTQGGRVNRQVLGNQKGFTLIEIIIVLVLLGILSATVAPKFLDLSTDARKAALDGLAGGLKSAGAIVNTACIISTTCAEATDTGQSVTVGGSSIAVAYGWPTIASIDTAAGVTMGKFTAGNSGTTRTYTLQGSCTVAYTEAASAGASATVVITDSGC